MERIRVQRKTAKHRRPLLEILPLDPRDPDVVRAKQLLDREPPRRRAA